MTQLHAVFEDEEGIHVVLESCKAAALLEQIHNRVGTQGLWFPLGPGYLAFWCWCC
jgi:hypothetical protein